MIRRTAAAATVPVTAALAITLAAPAQASTSAKTVSYYGSCRLLVPSTARVVQGGTEVPVRVTGGCALHPIDVAVWRLSGAVQDPDVAFDTAFFLGGYRTTWDAQSRSPPGTRTWTGLGAVDDNDNFYSQDAPRTTVKVGSWAGLQTKRSGNTITIDSRAVRYATSLDYTIPWAGQGATIQYRTIGSSIWTNLKLATTNPKGAITYNYTTTAKRDYRVRYNEAAYIWGATSPTSRR